MSEENKWKSEESIMKRNELLCYCGHSYGVHGFRKKKCQGCECDTFKASKYEVDDQMGDMLWK